MARPTHSTHAQWSQIIIVICWMCQIHVHEGIALWLKGNAWKGTRSANQNSSVRSSLHSNGSPETGNRNVQVAFSPPSFRLSLSFVDDFSWFTSHKWVTYFDCKFADWNPNKQHNTRARGRQTFKLCIIQTQTNIGLTMPRDVGCDVPGVAVLLSYAIAICATERRIRTQCVTFMSRLCTERWMLGRWKWTPNQIRLVLPNVNGMCILSSLALYLRKVRAENRNNLEFRS